MKNLLVAQLTCSLLLASCSAPSNPRELLVAVDASGSTETAMAGYVHALGRVAATLKVNDSQQTLVVYRYDRECHEVHDGPRRLSPERLTLSLKKSLAPSPHGGTSLARAMTALASRAEKAAAPTDVLLFTDGGDDDVRPSAAREVLVAADRLARNPRVRSVVVAGAKTGLRDGLRAALTPLGAKLRLVEVAAAAEAVKETSTPSREMKAQS